MSDIVRKMAKRSLVPINVSSTSLTYQTIPWAPDPMGLRFWYRFRMVNLVSPTSTV